MLTINKCLHTGMPDNGPSAATTSQPQARPHAWHFVVIGPLVACLILPPAMLPPRPCAGLLALSLQVPAPKTLACDTAACKCCIRIWMASSAATAHPVCLHCRARSVHVPVPARGASPQPAFAPGVKVLMLGIALGPYGKHARATWAGLFASTAATATETDLH